ncbi:MULTISPECIES: DUF6710 family protein [Enterobacterales]|uniref:Uncharacterized protein n=2 Tax=Morganellaceae TaxID=1903414 RepID=A0A899NI33_PROST|nr:MULTISPECIES: DUF6710 family protein [Enterobacterales]QHP74637.1 hypothetical protein EKQ45_01015 [Proteus vulgaris]MBN4867581.1 hypothetical protein [Providencia stuartii]MBN4877199.1 hypothetical protein [Providencia stuartii]MBN4881606.1 hypothetical protein [Providencia stuartii]MBN4886214.1 hypothetical protein [Providencia stuartii]
MFLSKLKNHIIKNHILDEQRKIQEMNYEKFNRIIAVGQSIGGRSIPLLINAIGRNIQSDLLIAVAEEGTDARSDDFVNPYKFFFSDIFDVLDYDALQSCLTHETSYVADLSTSLILPCPWNYNRYVSALSSIGFHAGNPWEQDEMNYRVMIWLPWNIAFVFGGNHSITAGVLANEGMIIPDTVYDMSPLFSQVKTDGKFWYRNGTVFDKVTCHRRAALFELGRMLTSATE